MEPTRFSITTGKSYAHIDSGITMIVVSYYSGSDSGVGVIRAKTGQITWLGSPRQFFAQFKPTKSQEGLF